MGVSYNFSFSPSLYLSASLILDLACAFEIYSILIVDMVSRCHSIRLHFSVASLCVVGPYKKRE